MYSMYDLSLLPPYSDIAAPQGYPLEAKRWPGNPRLNYGKKWQINYDYVLYMHFGGPKPPAIKNTQIKHQGSWFTIIKNNR